MAARSRISSRGSAWFYVRGRGRCDHLSRGGVCGPGDGCRLLQLWAARLEMRYAKAHLVPQLRKWVANDRKSHTARSRLQALPEIAARTRKDSEAGVSRLSWDFK